MSPGVCALELDPRLARSGRLAMTGADGRTAILGAICATVGIDWCICEPT